MSITYVGAGAVATGNDPTVSVPSGIQANDILVIFFTGQTSCATPTGYTQLYAQGTGRFLTIFYKTATGSETTVSLNNSSSDATVKAVIVAYRGVALLPSPIAGNTASASTGSSTSAATATFTALTNNTIISYFTADDASAATWTAPASTNSRVNSGPTTTINGILVVDEVASADTSTARTATLSVTNPWATYAFSLNEGRTLYWVGGTGTWTDTTKWSLSSGGAGGQAIPTRYDNVVIDSNSGTGTITSSSSASLLNLTVTATQAITLAVSNVLSIYQDVTLPSSGSFAVTDSSTTTPNLRFVGTGTLTANAIPLPGIYINTSGGTVTLGSDLVLTKRLEQAIGTLDTSSVGNYSITGTTYYNTSSSSWTLNLNASTITMSSSFVNQVSEFAWYMSSSVGTLNAGTSTINLTGAYPYLNTNTARTFYNVACTNSDNTAVGFSGANTFNNLTFTSRSSVGIYTLSISSSITVNGTLTLGTANAVNKRIRLSGGGTLTVAAIATLSDVDFRRVTVAGASGTWSGTRLGDQGANSNITFDAGKTVYWNLAGTANWSDTGWATTNNGTPAVNNFPLAQDTAVFTEAGSAGTITYDYSWSIGTIQMADGVSNRTTAFTLAGTNTLWISGDITLFPSLNLTATSTWGIYGIGVTRYLNFAGITLPGIFATSNDSGTAILLSDLTSSSASRSIISTGTFDANGYNVTCFGISSSSGTTTMGSGTWTLTGSGTAIWSYSNSAAVNAGTSTIVLSDTTTGARTFAGNNLTYNDLVIGGSTGTSTLTITGANTFGEISSTKTVAHTITFSGNQTIGTWSVTGSAGNVVTVNSNTVGTQRSLTITNKTTGINYLSFTDIKSLNVSPITFWAGADSVNSANTEGIAFQSGINNEAYVVTSGTTWTVPNDWNSASNEIHLIGGGGGGSGSGNSGVNRAAGSAGGGGAYTKLSNVTLTPSSSYSIALGAGGAGGASGITSTGGTGGATTFNDGTNTYTANAGGGGSINAAIPSSTAGTGGTAQSIAGLISAAYAGGNGGAGGTNTVSRANGGPGGGGAAGPSGNGAVGGVGRTSILVSSDFTAGGGGGNGGGSAGGNGSSSSVSGAGGNNALGAGGGAALTTSGNGNPGSNGGGGSGASGSGFAGGNGGDGVEILGAVGSGGGSGGSTGNNTASAGLYGAGGGGAGNGSSTYFAGGNGAQGVIIVVYVPLRVFNSDITENSSIADVINSIIAFTRSATESLTSASIESTQAAYAGVRVEPILVAETESAQTNFNSTATENTTVNDIESAQAVLQAARTENSTLTASQLASLLTNASITETIIIAETSNTVNVFNAQITEPSILNNLQSYINVVNTSISESVTVADTQDGKPVFVVSLVETITSDNTQAVVAIFNAVDVESLASDSSQVAQVNFNAVKTEPTTIAEAQTTQTNFNSAAVEPTTLADNSVAFRFLTADTVEGITPDDSATAIFIFASDVVETVEVADIAEAQQTLYSFVTEAINITDFTVGYGWFRVVDAQTVVWTGVDDTQTVTWTNVSDTQTPNWVIVNDEQP